MLLAAKKNACVCQPLHACVCLHVPASACLCMLRVPAFACLRMPACASLCMPVYVCVCQPLHACVCLPQMHASQSTGHPISNVGLHRSETPLEMQASLESHGVNPLLNQVNNLSEQPE